MSQSLDKDLMKMRVAKLRQMESLPLSAKIEASGRRISEWYNHYDGDVSIAFSGGLDSTVLCHLVRSRYPEVRAYFSNTGLEYPENVEFVKTTDNVEIIRPKVSFLSVIRKYGYPVVSKRISQSIYEFGRSKNEDSRRLYRWGIGKDGKKHTKEIPLRWQFLLDAPFKISDLCCDYLKKKPMGKIRNPFVGMLVSESNHRELVYKRTGCNYFDSEKGNRSWPMAFWTKSDVWEYVKLCKLSYSKIYDMGYERTGCMFCLFGLHLEGRPNRFDRMKISHPEIYKYCMDGPLGLREIIWYVYGKKMLMKGFLIDLIANNQVKGEWYAS